MKNFLSHTKEKSPQRTIKLGHQSADNNNQRSINMLLPKDPQQTYQKQFELKQLHRQHYFRQLDRFVEGEIRFQDFLERINFPQKFIEPEYQRESRMDNDIFTMIKQFYNSSPDKKKVTDIFNPKKIQQQTQQLKQEKKNQLLNLQKRKMSQEDYANMLKASKKFYVPRNLLRQYNIQKDINKDPKYKDIPSKFFKEYKSEENNDMDVKQDNFIKNNTAQIPEDQMKTSSETTKNKSTSFQNNSAVQLSRQPVNRQNYIRRNIKTHQVLSRSQKCFPKSLEDSARTPDSNSIQKHKHRNPSIQATLPNNPSKFSKSFFMEKENKGAFSCTSLQSRKNLRSFKKHQKNCENIEEHAPQKNFSQISTDASPFQKSFLYNFHHRISSNSFSQKIQESVKSHQIIILKQKQQQQQQASLHNEQNPVEFSYRRLYNQQKITNRQSSEEHSQIFGGTLPTHINCKKQNITLKNEQNEENQKDESKLNIYLKNYFCKKYNKDTQIFE